MNSDTVNSMGDTVLSNHRRYPERARKRPKRCPAEYLFVDYQTAKLLRVKAEHKTISRSCVKPLNSKSVEAVMPISMPIAGILEAVTDALLATEIRNRSET